VKAALTLSVAGVALALIPTALYIYSGIGSPLQAQLDAPVAGVPLLLFLTGVGVALTLPGILLFVRAMRQPLPATPPPARARRAPSMSRPVLRGTEENVETIERHLDQMLRETGSGEPSKAAPVARPETSPKPPTARGAKREPVRQSPVERPEEKPVVPTQGRQLFVVLNRGTETVCRECGGLNPLGANVCAECGAVMFKREEGELSCPVCGAPMKNALKVGENMVCQLCFSELKAEKALS